MPDLIFQLAPYYTSAWLILDMIGVVVVFFFGLPPSVTRRGADYVVNRPSSETERTARQREARTNAFMATLGLLLLFFGFGLQLAGNVMN